MILQNRVSHLHSLSSEVHFDFSNPSTRISLQNKSHADRVSKYNINLEDLENVSAAKFNLWPMFIRMISLFLMRSRCSFQHISLLSCFYYHDFVPFRLLAVTMLLVSSYSDIQALYSIFLYLVDIPDSCFSVKSL